MRISSATAFCAFIIASSITVAQTPPSSGPAPDANTGQGAGRAGGANAATAMGRPADVSSPGQAGRQALYKYLDDIAAKDEAVRRQTIAGITTRAQAELRQQEVRARMLDLMGGGFQRTPLNAKVVGETQMEGFRIEKVLYESQPDFFVTALLYVPDATSRPQGLKPDSASSANGTAEAVPLSETKTSAMAGGEKTNAGILRSAQNDKGEKFPAIVMAPGHAASGKAGDYAMASTFARNGFVVLSYDPIGQGERLEYPDPAKAAAMQTGDPYPGVSLATKSTGEHGEAGLQPTLIGDAVARYFAWDGMRAVDYLASRPEVDAEKIGGFGCSGGGAMTALLGAADKRVKAVATACYLTTMDTLLPSIGAQDAEQSTPGFIASGFDFADWVELAAPRAYAMVGTVSDMFPWKGFLETATEARRFYSLFDASAEGVGSCPLQVAGCQEKLLTTPTGPTLNPDTANSVPASSPFQVIAGIGGHGNLRPLTAQIVGFFLVHLAGKSAHSFVGDAAAAVGQGAVNSPGSTASNLGHPAPKGALQVTATGQVATSYPGSETVHSLNLKRAKEKLPQLPVQTLLQVQTDVREVTAAEAVPGQFKGPDVDPIKDDGSSTRERVTLSVAPGVASGPSIRERVTLSVAPGVDLPAYLDFANVPGKHPAIVRLQNDLEAPYDANNPEDIAELVAEEMNVRLLAFTPRPSPPGDEEIKSPILGPFYMTELRAELVGKTLLGMRVDDVIRAVDYLASRPDVDAKNITVVASGHMGLVALHAAVLDSRIKHVTVDHVLESYASLLKAPMPLDAPQDVLPGVLLKYDVPDLVRVLGDRVTATDWLKGTDNLAVK